MRSSLRCLGLALVGALGFGSMAVAVWGESASPSPLASLLTLPLAGAVGGSGLASLTKGVRAVPDAALRFALGFVLSALMAWFSLISLQARVEPSSGAIVWGIGLGLGGGIGGSS